jgi:glycosyltransferase involved in cell wall biosynthesis
MVENEYKKRKICHLTIVHNRYDPRILEKQCVSLAKGEFNVTLLVSDAIPDEIYKGVDIVSIGNLGKRLNFKIVKKIIAIIKKEKFEIIHFHDPELILLGLILRILTTNKIIYDIHEDYVTAVDHKKGNLLYKTILKIGFYVLEFLAKQLFSLVIAEKYYKYRFPKAIPILNYPIVDDNQIKTIRTFQSSKLIYTGNVTSSRGAYIHADIVNHSKIYSVNFIGKCNERIYNSLIERCKLNSDRILFESVGAYVPFSIIQQRYAEEWLAGLAIFPDTPHYRQKELTKFFEYMQQGLPVICSNFKVWKELIEDNYCGICVEPNNRNQIIDAVDYLFQNPTIANQMGTNGQRLVREKYNWKIEENKLISFYNNLL